MQVKRGSALLEDTLPEAGDLDAWLDARDILMRCPPGIISIARRLEAGEPLTPGQKACLSRFRSGKGPGAARGDIYRRRRSQGLCVSCGGETDGHARCVRCRRYAREHQALYRQKAGLARQSELREHWGREGRCIRCGGVPEAGKRKCSRCLALDRESLRRWREKHPDSWASWYAEHGEEYNARRRVRRRKAAPAEE